MPKFIDPIFDDEPINMMQWQKGSDGYMRKEKCKVETVKEALLFTRKFFNGHIKFKNNYTNTFVTERALCHE